MFQIFVIFFREILEIAIVLGIINASTTHVKNRLIYITIGVTIAIFLSICLAIYSSYIFNKFEYAQEILNASFLLVATFMLICTIVWMKQNSKNVIKNIESHSLKTLNSKWPMISLCILTTSIVLRESIEIVLFSYSVIMTSNESAINLVFGAIIGSVSAIIVGFLIQIGILALKSRYIFKVTSILLSLIAAGIAAQAANFLMAGEVIKSFEPLWDTSGIVSSGSALGQILHVVVGYTPNPTLPEVAFYLGTLSIIWFSAYSGKNIKKL